MHKELGDSFISISLDTDPNEDAQKILEHIERNGFDWFYVISPREMTKALIDEFGIGFVNAPSAPIVIIDENKNARLLRNGVKSSSELKKELGLWWKEELGDITKGAIVGGLHPRNFARQMIIIASRITSKGNLGSLDNGQHIT